MTEIMDRLTAALTDRYRIERELGQGGMATVYLAQDIRHDRKVALKVLRPELAAVIGAERFLAEIKTTANLQHPHILALFDSGHTGEGPGGRGDFVYYVMPYVEGESLRDRLQREQQLPVEDAVRIAREVADALEYAHAHGVIHRDIKPENILLHGGHAMVADFGIALAAARSEGGSRMTETGMSLGTPHYMSPEQAMGQREITARSDVYALGCVLYEMLSGEPPFNGPTPQAIVARVMTDEPRPLTLQRKSIPPHIEAAVMTALEKLPADRFSSAAAFGAALGNAGFASQKSVPLAAPVPAVPWFRRHLAVLAVATVLVALVAVTTSTLLTVRPVVPPARFALTLPVDVPPYGVRLSPDGSTIAYVAPEGGEVAIYTRRLDELDAHLVAGSQGAFSVHFSPDGEWIVFVVGGQARKVPAGGGAPVAIPIHGNPTITNIAWYDAERFVVEMGYGSLALLESDGSMRTFAEPDSGSRGLILQLDQVLPDGWVLAREWKNPPLGPVVAIDPVTGRQIRVVDQDLSWCGAGDGFLAWALPDGTLFAAPFDLKKKKITGPGKPVGGSAFVVLGFPPSVSVVGDALVYVPTRARILGRVDRAGGFSTLLGTDRTYHSPRVSPDGRRIAVDFTDQQRDLWIYDLVDSTLTRFGFDSSAHDPTWLPDGSGLLFAAVRGSMIGVFRRRFDGRPKADSILVTGLQLSAHTVTPDGKTAVAASLERGQFDLVNLSLDDGKLDTLAGTAYAEAFPALSPDGRWLAYVSEESGRSEVYVRSYPGFGSKVQVSQDGGTEPVWARSGKELFFRSGGRQTPQLIAAAVEAAASFRITSRRPLFNVAGYENANPHANYDVFPDGKSFVMVRQGRPGQSAEIVYLQNVKGLLQGRTQ